MESSRSVAKNNKPNLTNTAAQLVQPINSKTKNEVGRPPDEPNDNATKILQPGTRQKIAISQY
jgi:hypothetical protein